ncbi:MAG: ABC transporter substrate-binding protein [Acidimicrobiia bacterium]
MHTFSRRVGPIALVVVALTLATACSSSSKSSTGTTSPGKGASTSASKVTLRLGYLPNVTHAPAIIALQNGTFATDLGPNVDLKTSTYNSGTDETTALLAGALDAAFVGPNPAINAYQKSGGTLIRIVAGTASGGAFLIVKPSIKTPADLRGKKLATPSLGNTQDVALRTWLSSKGLTTTTTGGGDVSVVPQNNSLTVTAFKTGAIDGAWVPEPYATELQQAGGVIMVNEANLWPQGKFVTTNLVVTTQFLDAHPDIVSNLLKGLSAAIDLTKTNPDQAELLVSRGIGTATGKSPAVSLVKRSFSSITFTLDPIASSLKKDAASAEALGFIKSTNLANIYDLSLLNKLLVSQGKPTISP